MNALRRGGVRRSLLRWGVSGVLFLGVAWVNTPVWAESAKDAAARLDREAREAFGRGDHEVAARAFEEAYRYSPHPATKYNEALAWEKAKELARAADAYQAALESSGLDDQRAEDARSKLAALKQRVGSVYIKRPMGAAASVAHAKGVPVPARIHLAPGAHKLTVTRADGSEEVKSLNIRAGETVSVDFADTEPGLVDSPGPITDSGTTAKPEESGGSSQATWGWISLGLGGAATIGGVVLGLQTVKARDDFEDSGRRDEDLRDKTLQLRTLTNVAFGVAVVGVGLGVTLLLTAPSDDTTESSAGAQTRAEIRVLPNGLMGSITF